MDQQKIGAFIANVRKKEGMSQKQLADIIGVTDKTISKWECGKSIPDLSKIEALCNALQINVNELLSGEHLSGDTYLRKAEENMINLIHESETKASDTNSVNLIIAIIMSLLPIVFSILYGRGFYFEGRIRWTAWIDIPTIVPMISITVIYLIGTKTMKIFLKAFFIVNKKRDYCNTEIKTISSAIKLVQVSWLITGLLVSVMGYISTAFMVTNEQVGYELTAMNFALASLGIVYGLVGYLILIPIHIRIELCSK